MSDIILCNVSDRFEILKEKRTEWVYKVLDGLNLPEDIEKYNNYTEFRNILNIHGIFIENKSGGEEIDIYKLKWSDDDGGGWLPLNDKYLIAQWKKPKYIKRIEGKDVYYELHINEWSMIKLK